MERFPSFIPKGPKIEKIQSCLKFSIFGHLLLFLSASWIVFFGSEAFCHNGPLAPPCMLERYTCDPDRSAAQRMKFSISQVLVVLGPIGLCPLAAGL